MANLIALYAGIFGSRRTKMKTASVPNSLVPAPLVTKEQIIALLNEDIILEYTAALQYVQHYSVVQGAQYDAIRDHLKEHAEQEIGHAITLSDKVNFLGGVPVAGAAQIKTAPDVVTMLNMNLTDERTAASRYKERIIQSMSIGEFGLADILQDILKDEEEHANDLSTTLDAPTGELNSAPPYVPSTMGIPAMPLNSISAVPASVAPAKAQEYVPVMAENAEFRENREKRRTAIDEKLEKFKKASL